MNGWVLSWIRRSSFDPDRIAVDVTGIVGQIVSIIVEILGILRPNGVRHSYHDVNRSGNVGTLLSVCGNQGGAYQKFKKERYRY